MTPLDPFGRTDKLDEGMLEALVVRFEARGEHPLFSEMLQEYLDADADMQRTCFARRGCRAT